MAQSYFPFPTNLNPAESSLVKRVLQDCIPCNLMCMAPHNMPWHARYTHVHDCGSNIFVTIVTPARGNGTPRPVSFKATVEDAGRLLMKGVLLPVGHYPVSDTTSGNVQTNVSSTAPNASSTTNANAAAPPFPPQSAPPPGDFTLTDSVQSTYK